MKNFKNFSLLAATVVCAAAFVGCKKEEAPSISIADVTATDTEISFKLNVSNADKVAYMCVEKGQDVATADAVLAKGELSTGNAVETVSDLQPATTYIITVAASGNGGVSSNSIEVDTEWTKFTVASSDNYNTASENNYSLSFKTNSDPAAVLNLDTYSESFKFLKEGTYVVGGSAYPYIDSGISYTNYTADGKTKQALKGGTVDVKVDLENKVYAIVFDLILDDETPLKAKYNGAIDGADIFDEFAFTLNAAKRADINNPAPGEFYIKLNDSDWKFDVVLDFFTQDASLTELPAGEYKFSETTTSGLCFGPKSEIACYNQPVKGGKFTSGTVTVAKEGSKYTISIDAADATGQRFVGTYSGEIADMTK